MATTADFVDAVGAAGDALTSLSLKAHALHVAATNDQDVGLAEQAIKLADDVGPRVLQKVKDTGDAHQLQNLQHAVKGASDDVSDDLMSDVIKRFLMLPLSPLLALAPAQVLDEAAEALANVPTPTPPQDSPWYYWAGGGGLGGLLFGLASTGSPRMALVAGGAGVALGLGARHVLKKIGAAFTF